MDFLAGIINALHLNKENKISINNVGNKEIEWGRSKVYYTTLFMVLFAGVGIEVIDTIIENVVIESIVEITLMVIMWVFWYAQIAKFKDTCISKGIITGLLANTISEDAVVLKENDVAWNNAAEKLNGLIISILNYQSVLAYDVHDGKSVNNMSMSECIYIKYLTDIYYQIAMRLAFMLNSIDDYYQKPVRVCDRIHQFIEYWDQASDPDKCKEILDKIDNSLCYESPEAISIRTISEEVIETLEKYNTAVLNHKIIENIAVELGDKFHKRDFMQLIYREAPEESAKLIKQTMEET